ncbi:MAG: sulfatase-like hydrolase/transferase, partial [Candidatus Eisenbacteria bacterium]|nr:sulfatase-like hydrolase/transferase [Candidatus Eisenbacteria bacterium]
MGVRDASATSSHRRRPSGGRGSDALLRRAQDAAVRSVSRGEGGRTGQCPGNPGPPVRTRAEGADPDRTMRAEGRRVSTPRNRPNILYLFTDQQSASMMSCAGNRHVDTPAMDSLAQTGTRFTRAYCTNPVCVPSRTSMFSGRMPGHFGITANADGRAARVTDTDLRNSMGQLFARAGYEVVYAGKKHLPAAMQPDDMAFTTLTTDSREGLSAACVEFLRRDHDRPFLLAASFVNPHDICFMSLDAYAKATDGPLAYPDSKRPREVLREEARIPEGTSEAEFLAARCPPLPDNHGVTAHEPGYYTLGDRAARIRYVRERWTERDWRHYRYAYARLTERVDRQIGAVLAALRECGLEERTVVVFSSDHGEMNGSHKMVVKSTFYEEAST